MKFWELVEDFKLLPISLLIFLCLGLKCIFIEISYADALAFTVACGGLCFDRYQLSKDKITQDAASDLNMVMIQNQLDQIKADHESVHKLAEESKKLLSQGNLALGFKPRSTRQ